MASLVEALTKLQLEVARQAAELEEQRATIARHEASIKELLLDCSRKNSGRAQTMDRRLDPTTKRTRVGADGIETCHLNVTCDLNVLGDFIWNGQRVAFDPPTAAPSALPSGQPSFVPTERPVPMPTPHPTIQPTNQPSTTPWTLLHLGWIPSFTSSMPAWALAQGQTVTGSSDPVDYQQVYLACKASGRTVKRVLTLATPSATAAAPKTISPSVVYYSGDYGGAGNYNYGENPNVEWNEMHSWQGSPGWPRFLIRIDQVHCAMSYEVLSGGDSNNPELGNYGMVWVRQGTDPVSEADLPGGGV